MHRLAASQKATLASKQILCIKEQIHSTTLNVQPNSSQNYTYIDFLIHRRSGTQLVGWWWGWPDSGRILAGIVKGTWGSIFLLGCLFFSSTFLFLFILFSFFGFFSFLTFTSFLLFLLCIFRFFLGSLNTRRKFTNSKSRVSLVKTFLQKFAVKAQLSESFPQAANAIHPEAREQTRLASQWFARGPYSHTTWNLHLGALLLSKPQSEYFFFVCLMVIFYPLKHQLC